MNQSLNIYTDGGSRGNPGPSAIGVVIKDKLGKILHQFGETIGHATNNVAEYQGVIFALNYLVSQQTKPTTINFFLDSTLVVNQLNGLWKIKDANLRTLVIKVRQLEGQLNAGICYHSIPREKNHEADALLNQALDTNS
jgi:ribonuclease H / adenosylcobalamin/alpha-ribazole phosphatase